MSSPSDFSSNHGDRGSLTPEDQAFLEQPPEYERQSLVPQSASLVPPAASRALPTRSLVIFAAITCAASIVLAIAVARLVMSLLVGG